VSLAFRLADEEFRTEIRRHDDQRVAEVHGAALTVGQAAVIEHLQQHVEDNRDAPFSISSNSTTW